MRGNKFKQTTSLILGLALIPSVAFGQANTVTNWQTGTTSTGAPINSPVSATNPLPVTETPTPGSISDVNIKQVGGTAVTVGAGAASTGTQRVILSSDSPGGGVTQGSTTSGQSGGLGMAATTTASPSYATGTTNPISCDPFGSCRVLIQTSSGVSVDYTAPVNIFSGGPGNVPAGGITQVAASSGNVAAAIATATMPAVAAKTNFVDGFECAAGGATLGSDISITLTGTISSTNLTYTYSVPAGVLLAGVPLVVSFQHPIPGTAINTAISITMPSAGTGNTNASCNIHGFVQ